MPVLVDQIHAKLMADPDFKPQKGKSKDESAWAVAWSRYKQIDRNNKALDMAPSDVHEKKQKDDEELEKEGWVIEKDDFIVKNWGPVGNETPRPATDYSGSVKKLPKALLGDKPTEKKAGEHKVTYRGTYKPFYKTLENLRKHRAIFRSFMEKKEYHPSDEFLFSDRFKHNDGNTEEEWIVGTLEKLQKNALGRNDSQGYKRNSGQFSSRNMHTKG